jgi:hypothetical protein
MESIAGSQNQISVKSDADSTKRRANYQQLSPQTTPTPKTNTYQAQDFSTSAMTFREQVANQQLVLKRLWTLGI